MITIHPQTTGNTNPLKLKLDCLNENDSDQLTPVGLIFVIFPEYFRPMRITSFLLVTLITGGLIFVLNRKWGTVPPLGKFLSPQFGIWQNAEPVNEDFNADIAGLDVREPVTVYFDERLVPHLFAENDADACYVQGYLHARFRLWQMEFQTHAAAGRISEIIGEKALDYDRTKRRVGMIFAAERLLHEIESNPFTKEAVDRYTAGVNAWISSLTESSLPLEYKLLDYKPEKWTNLKTALFIKQMTETLSGHTDDLPMTSAKGFFTDEQLQVLFPQVPDSLSPIVPKGTVFPPPSVVPQKPATADSVYLGKQSGTELAERYSPDPDNGSNNWAVSGRRTSSGAPILCNDPHLELTLPSIWYEMQVSIPGMNVYGVSFPGIPYIVIGFNDNIAFGFTNSQRDIKDYYEVEFRDESRSEYLFNGEWVPVEKRPETILVKGSAPFYDTVAYTVFGPVLYDNSFPASNNHGNLAVRWSAHDPSNELLMWYYLNRAANYNDYHQAIQYFTCPGQNIVFASKSGDIAIWQQGRFPALWDRQGLYVMPGIDSSYMWQGYIPSDENPHSINPERGFVSSANQRPADSSYPYFIPGGYDLYRGYTINKVLAADSLVTPQDMMDLQNNNFNAMASMLRPVLLSYLDQESLNEEETGLLNLFKSWNLRNDYDEVGPVIFASWIDSLQVAVWNDEWERINRSDLFPSEKTLAEALLRDSSFQYVDNINTPQTETWASVINASFRQAAAALAYIKDKDEFKWGVQKNTTVYHLLRTSVMPFARKGIPVGGGLHIVNAVQHSHGPSWRMVVQLTGNTEAWGVYPGGQNGNPGSRYYDQFIDDWAAGKYYSLWFMHGGDKHDQKVKWTILFSKK